MRPSPGSTTSSAAPIFLTGSKKKSGNLSRMLSSGLKKRLGALDVMPAQPRKVARPMDSPATGCDALGFGLLIR